MDDTLSNMWNATLYLWLGSFIRSQMFQVSDGNDDWGELVNPETYGLEHAQNIYLASDSVDDSAAGETFDPDDKIGAWWIRAEPKSMYPCIMTSAMWYHNTVSL